MTMAEESGKILLLRTKYHAEAAGYIFIFGKKNQFPFESLLTRGPKNVSNQKSGNVGLHGALPHMRHGKICSRKAMKDGRKTKTTCMVNIKSIYIYNYEADITISSKIFNLNPMQNSMGRIS